VARVNPQNTFTVPLSPEQQETLARHVRAGNYRPRQVEYARVAVEGTDCQIVLYNSGKCVVQGRGARDWVTYVLEPLILQEARLGYEDVRNPGWSQPHMGVDESGKGDFFGPLVIAAAYTDAALTAAFRKLNVRDSKSITSDTRAEEMAREIRKLLDGRYAVVAIGPRAYNRLYASMRNVNRILAWGHARAIENLLEKVPDCPRALADQFGPRRQIEQALMKKGRSIQLEQQPRAESDPAVAAASVLARAAFLHALREIGRTYHVTVPKGASAQVQALGEKLVREHGASVLLETAKCHFKTADAVLAGASLTRAALGPEGAATSKITRERNDETR
jgi:ribonuclease HIII